MSTANAVLLGVGAACGALLAVLGLAGALWQVALPWLRQQLAEPVSEIRDQVKNTHDTNLRDDLDEVISSIGALDRRTARMGLQLDAHLTASAAAEAATNSRLTALENRGD